MVSHLPQPLSPSLPFTFLALFLTLKLTTREQSLPPGVGRGTQESQLTQTHVTLVQQAQAEMDENDGRQPIMNSILNYRGQQGFGAAMTQEIRDNSSFDPDVIADSSCMIAMLDSLDFASRRSRDEAIPEAYSQTYDWIFKPPPQSQNGQPLWSDFPAWARGDSSDVYWITGKPGAGKSTMMKYLTSQDRVLSLLADWSSSNPVHVAGFYSWKPGSNELQKSQVGLLRTLLYQILSRVPYMVPTLFPGRWAMLKIFGPKTASELPPWTLTELYNGFTTLTRSDKQDFSLAIFIDGLDEFEGDHQRLIDLVKNMHNRPRVKVCISSRPWNLFRDAFSSCPNLQLEHLTKKDMETFVHGEFQSNKAFTELHAALPQEAEALMEGLVKRAEGVFLWVSLVTGLILDGISEGDMLREAQKTMDDLPSDMNGLYQSLWDRVHPRFKCDRARILLILRAYSHQGASVDVSNTASDASAVGSIDHFYPDHLTQRFPRLPAVTLWFAEDGVWVEPEHLVKMLTRRLDGYTRGLLEISTPTPDSENIAECLGAVDYLHRTARDWVYAGNRWAEIEDTAAVDFDIHLALLKGTVKTLKYYRDWDLQERLDYGATDRSYLERRFVKDYEMPMFLASFFHALHMKRSPTSTDCLVELLDGLADDMITRYGKVRPAVTWQNLPHWTSPATRQKDFFVALAAEYGIVDYVKAKAEVNLQCLETECDGTSIISGLILGPVQGGFWDKEFKSFGERIRPLSENISLGEFSPYIHMIERFDTSSRYNLAAELLQAVVNKSQGSKASGPSPSMECISNNLGRLYKRMSHVGGPAWENHFNELITLSIVTRVRALSGSKGTKQVRYGKAILQLLESHSELLVKPSMKDNLRMLVRRVKERIDA